MALRLRTVQGLRMPGDLSALLHNSSCFLLQNKYNFTHIPYYAGLYVTAHFIIKPIINVLVWAVAF